MKTRPALLPLTALLSVLPAALSFAGPIDIGSRLQLMVDDHLVEKWSGRARLRLHAPEARDIVLTFDKSWEGNTSMVLNCFRDGDVFRMFYRAENYAAVGKDRTHPSFLCLAESDDGIHWRRPDLGLVEFEGGRQNNIISTQILVPFKDTNPNAAPEARYKGFGVSTFLNPRRRELFVYQSADGLHWQKMRGEPVMTKGVTPHAFDSVNTGFWDPLRGEYRAYIRDYLDGKRRIKTATSQDFMNWSEPQWLEFPNATQEELYTNMVRPYAENPELFIGFPTRFLEERGSATEPLFMSSRDGRSFKLWEEAVIRPGRNSDRWGNRCNYIWYGMIDTLSDLPGSPRELSIFSGEHYYMEGGVKVRRFTYRPDGFVSVNAPWAGGEFVTKPLIFSGGHLAVNAATAAAGGVCCEIQDEDGSPIPGFSLNECVEFYGDQTKQIVAWKHKTSLSGLAGKPVRLRMVLKDADLYSFVFQSEDK